MSEKETLFDVITTAAAIEALLIESDGEITEDIEKMLVVKDVQLPAKVDSYGVVMDRMKMIQEFYEEKAKRYKNFANAAQVVQERCKENINHAMNSLDTKELSGWETKFRLMRSAPSCNIVDESAVPELYKTQVITTKIDKKLILEHAKIGANVPGVEIEQKEYVRKFDSRK